MASSLRLDKTIATAREVVNGTATTIAAVKAMDKAMRDATASYIGADLRMSGFKGGPAQFKGEAKSGSATLTMSGGTYALADKGRRRKRKRLWPKPGRRRGRRSALDTPGGWRRWSTGSTWPGFNITERHGPDALDAGIEAARAEILKGWS